MKKGLLVGLVLTTILSCGLLFGATKADNKSLGSKTVAEGDTVAFAISATDPDGDTVTISAETLPSGSTLSPTVASADNHTANFSWTPDFNQAGVVELWLIAEDVHGAQDWGKVTITVTNTNRPPTLNNIQ
tara:strand:- start:8072 stop:8464 length:393 start_codon:yes stop_codon:yes gene_type:complete